MSRRCFGAVPQFQTVSAGAVLADRGDVGIVKLLAVGLTDKITQLFGGIIGQKSGQHGLGYFHIILQCHSSDLLGSKLRDFGGNKQAAVLGKTLQDGAGGSDPQVTVSGTAKFHKRIPPNAETGIQRLLSYTLS